MTVILVTYNHERYVADALASVLAQETPFAVEIIVSEDCSTDRTLDVVERVRDELAPSMTVLTSPVNLCSNEVFRRALERARGEFVAMLDGDDYWTDRHKLARQVAFLRERPDFAMCFHDVWTLDDSSGAVVAESSLGTRELTLCDLVLGNHIPSCTPVIRRAALADLPQWFDTAEFGDWPLYLTAVRHGRAGGVGATMGVYRLHSGGAWTGTAIERRERQRLRFLDRLDDATRRSCRDSWLRARGYAMRQIAEGLLEQGRRLHAMWFALRSLALPGLPGYGRRQSVKTLLQATSPALLRVVRRLRLRAA